MLVLKHFGRNAPTVAILDWLQLPQGHECERWESSATCSRLGMIGDRTGSRLYSGLCHCVLALRGFSRLGGSTEGCRLASLGYKLGQNAGGKKAQMRYI